MATFDAVIVGKVTIPEVGGGPIVPPGQPPGLWPPGSGIELPTHPIFLPPGFIDGVHPEHPIVIPPPPSPGHPAHPIVIPPEIWPSPGRPTHPIVIPPPPVIWPPGPGIDMPTHPIVIPPDGPPRVLENWDVKSYWTAEGGWSVAIVPSPEHPGVPTPSAATPRRP